ncbi:cadherin domain-containing protein, partial [Candidatus Poribacteria bacterium]|nr:cadherin domain-containing protein [Candidatus Poribacteria bacterium]
MLITVTLERVADNEFKAKVPTGAPFSIIVPVSVTNGSIDGGAITLTISTGKIYSESLTVTRTLNTTDDVTADVGTLPDLPSINHYGYTLTKPNSLPILIHRDPTNAVDPVFSDGETTTRSIAENTVAGQNIGTPVEATDDNGYTLTYSLSGTDAASFDIVSASGQLQTKASLDFETKSSYSVTITATTTEGLTDTISVTINVTDVNEAPVFSSVSTTLSVAENTDSGSNIGSPITATDEDNDTLSYRLSGTDAASFYIGETSGQLQTKAALDYESKNVYYVSVIASDGSLTASIPVTINITNIDEQDVNNAPVFTDGSSTTRSVQENTAAGVNIGSPVDATDADADTLTYAISGTDAASFDIVNTTGQIQTKASLDYETKSSYSVIVTATDTEDQSVTINVTINVTDVNEAPVFSSESIVLSIAENTAPGVAVGSPVTATDDDGDILTYSLSRTDAQSFYIVNTTGQIQTDASLDYETKNSYSVTVTATDGDNATDTIDVTINVTDVTEIGENVAPIFSDGESTTRSISENISSGTNIGTPVTATDGDGDELTYTLGGTDKASFSIDSTTGQLKTEDDLDYETKSTYAVTVTATDSSDLANTKSISVTINVTNVAEAPVFASDSINRSIAENTDEDVNIGSAISAIDGDGDELTYTLSGDDASSFSLDSTSGQLKTSDDLDYEDKRVYSVKVTASDGTLTDSVNVTIRVTNVHEEDINNYPEFVEGIATSRSVRENSSDGTAIGDTLNAIDSDGDQITYSLSGTNAASFSIHSNTGQLSTNAELDYETKNTYVVIVTVSDGNGGSASIDVTVNVIDVLESSALADRTNSVLLGIQNAITDMQIDTTLGINDAVLSAITSITVPSSTISTFKSGDFSGLTSLKSLIIENNLSLTSLPSDIFDELSSLEVLSLSGNSSLERLPSGVFDSLRMLETLRLVGNGLKNLPNDIFDELTLLEVLNLSSNSLNNLSQTIFQELTQLEELYLSHKSILSLQSDIFSGLSQLSTLQIDNNQLSSLPIGVFVGLTALDSVSIRQGDTQLSLSISLTIDLEEQIKASVDTGAPFDIVVPVIVTNGNIDQDTTSLTIQTGKIESDNVISVSRTTGTTAAVTAQIGTLPSLPTRHSGYSLSRSSSDEIEVIPAVEETSNSVPVFSDGSSTTRSIAENTAEGVNIGSAVSATDADDDTLNYSLGGTDATSFDIVSTSGQIRTKAALDYETKSSYSVTVTATDGNSGSDSISVTISVTDANDAPTFASDSVSLSVAENTDADTVFGDPISATDEDGDTLIYSLGGTDASSFTIDSTNGQLKTKAALDYETKSSYSVTVTATDADSGSDSINVTINITDVVEVTNNAPEFTEGDSTNRSVVENTDTGQNIGGAVSAMDSDDDTLTYSLGGTDAASFDIDTSNGQLKSKTHLNYETKNSYSVVVTVSDGSQTDTISITINVTDVNEA